AARAKIAPGRALRRQPMVDDYLRVIDQHRVRKGLAGANAELRLLAARSVGALAADALPEAAEAPEQRPPERHVAADRIAHGGEPVRLSGIATAHYPVELLRKPARPLPRPERPHAAADADDGRIGIVREHAREPVGFCDRVVVQKGDDRSARALDAGVARGRQTATPAVRNDLQLRIVGRDARLQSRIVVDDDDGLSGRAVLPANGIQRRPKAIPAPFGVGADDDGDGGPFDHQSTATDLDGTALACLPPIAAGRNAYGRSREF